MLHSAAPSNDPAKKRSPSGGKKRKKGKSDFHGWWDDDLICDCDISKQSSKSGWIMPPVKNSLSFCFPQRGDWNPKHVTAYMNIIILFLCLYWNNLTIPNNVIVHYTDFPKAPSILQ